MRQLMRLGRPEAAISQRVRRERRGGGQIVVVAGWESADKPGHALELRLAVFATEEQLVAVGAPGYNPRRPWAPRCEQSSCRFLDPLPEVAAVRRARGFRAKPAGRLRAPSAVLAHHTGVITAFAVRRCARRGAPPGRRSYPFENQGY